MSTTVPVIENILHQMSGAWSSVKWLNFITTTLLSFDIWYTSDVANNNLTWPFFCSEFGSNYSIIRHFSAEAAFFWLIELRFVFSQL